MELLESKEMYLETILLLNKKSAQVRSIDIADELGYSRASVSIALQKLVKLDLIIIDGGNIKLTEEGKKKAENIYERHLMLTKLFTKMGAKEDLAEENACKVEHVISEEMFAIIKKYLEKID